MTPPTLAPNHKSGCHKLTDAVVADHTIHLGKSKTLDALVRTRFERCVIRIHCGASALILDACTFVDCTFWPAKPMNNLRLQSSTLERCSFRGRYAGLQVGADARACDFSEATELDLCDFAAGNDVASHRFPAWPHVVVHEPARHLEQLRERVDDAGVLEMFEIMAEGPEIAACTLNVAASATDADAVRAALASCSCVTVGQPATSPA